jgi:hypothetical protein
MMIRFKFKWGENPSKEAARNAASVSQILDAIFPNLTEILKIIFKK